ncbi:tkl protein kinase [Ophiostoma piceae UAMH 11346]|uniref:Tkl protein kinase n=1 Tax=Ophiostoma piceae (strain UAMH 11346) TaxID=1262450 RepID=S3CIE5_OPHP1|nr:tkl protein kinase [Ophiostoma piceae UAMH 11346]
MAQQIVLPDDPPAPSAVPSSPTKSLWKRLLTRSSSANPDQNSHDVYPSGVPLPTLQIPETATRSIPARDGSECGDVLANDNVFAQKMASHGRRSQWDVVPNLPRSQTFARQQAELRENLLEVMPTSDERRAASVDRRLTRSVSSPSKPHSSSNPRSSAPSISHHREPRGRGLSVPRQNALPQDIPPVPPLPASSNRDDNAAPGDASATEMQIPDSGELSLSPQGLTFEEGRQSECLAHEAYADDHLREPFLVDTSSMTSSEYEQRIRYELEHIWILNLSMHFRDRSRREKFFVTYRQRPELSRRVTISLDYRNAQEGSLEMDLMNTKVQRDKNEMIYEAIRESLIDIQFYDTVTNLKLQTTEGRLHVHVVEDVTEIIDYPSGHFVQHLGCHKIKERDVEFESHMSGFVYKVRVDGRTLIKKEIPGPDSVDEFLYEVNALNFLRGSHNVIELYGIVIGEDDRVRGLLISYAEQGALIDILYENNHGIPWPTRMKWARQIVHGLSEVHEAGFVQGDFTLSNIVIDDFGNAKIIDINRRGCPVGWEPPEATPLIQSEQRISMYIGVKSDLYQLGMVLWALATQNDDPEAHGRPLHLEIGVGVPQWYRTIVETCLAEDPRVRAQARQLLSYFPSPSSMSGRLEDSDYDDDWVDGPHNPTFYAHSAPSGSLTDGKDSYRHKAGIESAASSDYNPDGIEQLPHGKGGHVEEKFADIAPRIKSVTPSNEWSYVNFGHTYVDPLNGVSNEPYYFPTRGRSPPSALRVGTRSDTSQREGSWARASSVEKRCLSPSLVSRDEMDNITVHENDEDDEDATKTGNTEAGTTVAVQGTVDDGDEAETEALSDVSASESTNQDDHAPASKHSDTSTIQQDSHLEAALEKEGTPGDSAPADSSSPVLDTDIPPKPDTAALPREAPPLYPGCLVDDNVCDDDEDDDDDDDLSDQAESYSLGSEKHVPHALDQPGVETKAHDTQHVDSDNKLPTLVTS